MKTIGMIGGMSWESTVTYYQIVNEVIRRELGGLHSAKCILHSVEFDEIERLQSTGEWEKSGEILGQAARGLEAAGADYILICTNTMHKVFDQVQSCVSVPLLHIAQMTADALKADDVEKVGLLGTKYTMEQEFYKAKLVENGIEVVIPGKEAVEVINDVIFHELCMGEIRDESRQAFLAAIDDMAERGAQAVILGCTEIGLLVRQSDTAVKLYDTTLIHAERAAMLSLE
ncbi:MAG: aspartate/glutamate racemase family protein [Oscillibacter sp.]|nr:aspartate/glutamate racemase family protein [Oscillibacter sp.]